VIEVETAPAYEVEREEESVPFATLAAAVLAPFASFVLMASPLIVDAALQAVGL
jgi:hypothetical protein